MAVFRLMQKASLYPAKTVPSPHGSPWSEDPKIVFELHLTATTFPSKQEGLAWRIHRPMHLIRRRNHDRSSVERNPVF
jgi:hypothetical protein